MLFWIKNIRKIIAWTSIAVALIIYFAVAADKNGFEAQAISLIRPFALTAVAYLYFALLASPLYTVFPTFRLRAVHVKARKAIGVSAFSFAAMHGVLAFFVQLGGFDGLQFLMGKYLWAIIFSTTALLILTVMAITSIGYLIAKLGKFWKPLHRFVYLAGVLIITHALIMGTDFQDLNPISITYLIALVFLFTLEAIRFCRYIAQIFRPKPPPPEIPAQ